MKLSEYVACHEIIFLVTDNVGVMLAVPCGFRKLGLGTSK